MTDQPTEQGTPIFSSGISDAPNPQQEALAAAGAAKLAAMKADAAAGKTSTAPTPSTTPARPAPAAPPRTTTPPPTPGQERLARLAAHDNPDGIWSKDPEKQKAAMAEHRRLSALEDQAYREQVRGMNNAELREHLGITIDVPEHLADKWDGEAEWKYTATMADNGVSADAAGQITAWYANMFTAAQGQADQIDATAMEMEFRELANRVGLPADVTDAMVRYERRRLGL
jgi:hypothetical protein